MCGEMRRCASRMAWRSGPDGKEVAGVFTGRPSNVVHYGTACPDLGHAVEKMRIFLAFPLHRARIAFTPSYFKTARISTSGEETMSSSERRIDPRVNVRVPLRFRVLNSA